MVIIWLLDAALFTGALVRRAMVFRLTMCWKTFGMFLDVLLDFDRILICVPDMISNVDASSTSRIRFTGKVCA
jgi:hypothetical protein